MWRQKKETGKGYDHATVFFVVDVCLFVFFA